MFECFSKIKCFTVFAVVHALVGLVGSVSKLPVGGFYVVAFLAMTVDVLAHKDKGSRAGFYAIYLMGFEIVYRISGVSLAYELGKYLSALILIVGMIGGKKRPPYIFLLLLILIIPSVFLAESQVEDRARKMVMFNLSGPLSLVISGMYFMYRKIDFETFFKGLKVAVLPAISVVVIISLKSNLSSLEFSSVQSSSGAAGGFGANQVSTALGWFILLILFTKLFGKSLLPYPFLDWVLLGIVLIRGLLTMSRGGFLSPVLGYSLGVLFLIFNDSYFRRKVVKFFPYIILGGAFLFGIAWYANSLSNNYLLYRYQGKSTNEVRRGIEEDKDYTTGRGELIKSQIVAFETYPVLGVGFGMAMFYNASRLAAHTEYSRLLAEHGMLGILYMLVAFIILPIIHFAKLRNKVSKVFFIAVFIVSFLTMLHSAMRLALPGILYGFSFLTIMNENAKPDREKYQYRKLTK